MKIRNIALVLVLALVLSTFSGCGLRQMEARLDAVEDAVENRVDKVEDAVESAIYGSPELKAPKAEKSAAMPSEKPSSGAPADKNYEPALSVEEAEKIALEHAGLSADEVNFIRREFEIDDGVKQYDIEFYHDRFEYEYSIHADSGDIISFEIDR